VHVAAADEEAPIGPKLPGAQPLAAATAVQAELPAEVE
jgi:hypothetical protein